MPRRIKTCYRLPESGCLVLIILYGSFFGWVAVAIAEIIKWIN